MPSGRPKKLKSIDSVDKVTTHLKQKEIIKAVANALIIQDTPDLDVWSDENRFLPPETSSEHGKWRTSRFPFLRRIMKCLSASSIAREVVFVKGGQLGGTECAINWLLYSTVCEPGPSAYVQKTIDAVKAFVKQKFRPAIRHCNAVDYTLGDKKPTGYSNAILDMGYPGGFISFGPANSSDFLKSKSLLRGVLDEEDQYELSIDNQGSPRLMLKKRMANFPNSKLFRISTPVLKELSTIEPGFHEGSEELYYVPCPNCNPEANDTKFMFAIEHDNIKWSKEINPKTNAPVKVWCECPSCGYEIDEAKHKTWMLKNGDWFSTKNYADPDTPLSRYRAGDVEFPSFRLPSFYSPLGFYSWYDAAHDFLEYKRTGDISLLQVYINQCCAETFSLTGSDIDHTGLYLRRESYCGSKNLFDVPNEGLCLTAGVDVQDDRLEVEVVAWGILEESWSIDYKVLPGDTALTGNIYGMLPNGQPTVWRLLHDYLSKRWRHESGVDMPVEVTMIDSGGHRSDEVHQFCRPRENLRVWPIKGQGGWGNGLWRRSTRRHEKYKTIDYRLFVDELKSKLYAFLRIQDPGPGYCHFPKKDVYSEKYFRGLTCERLKTRIVRGQQQLYWDTPPGARNEPLDCRNYAYAAFSAYGIDLFKRASVGLQSIFGNMAAPVRKLQRRKGSSGL